MLHYNLVYYWRTICNLFWYFGYNALLLGEENEPATVAYFSECVNVYLIYVPIHYGKTSGSFAFNTTCLLVNPYLTDYHSSNNKWNCRTSWYISRYCCCDFYTILYPQQADRLHNTYTTYWVKSAMTSIDCTIHTRLTELNQLWLASIVQYIHDLLS